MTQPAQTTVQELLAREPLRAGARTQGCHLHFNGPGAAGFGVKRAAMLLPESAMLLVAPSCCGRHGTITGNKTGFDERIFYLQMDERDVVTGAYLRRIPEAAALAAKRAHPKALILCMTCVDALLGTDIDRVAREAERACGVPVTGCFMDPIARESKNAPMVSVQQAVMRFLLPAKTDPGQVNLLGNFAPLEAASELPRLLKQAGISRIGQLSACKSFAEYQALARARLNVVVHPQAAASAKDLERRLGIPFVEISHTYGVERTAEQMDALGRSLGKALDFAADAARAKEALSAFAARHAGLRIAVGEAVNGNPFEIAETLLEAGLEVPFVLRNLLSRQDLPILRRLAALRPDLPVYSGVHPSMQGAPLPPADVALGLDAGYFLPKASSVCWNMERQPFGFSGLTALLSEIEACIAHPLPHREQMHGSYLVV